MHLCLTLTIMSQFFSPDTHKSHCSDHKQLSFCTIKGLFLEHVQKELRKFLFFKELFCNVFGSIDNSDNMFYF